MWVRRHLSYANVTATAALFFALGGGAYAVARVDSRDIANDSVKSVDLKNRRAVRGEDVKRNTDCDPSAGFVRCAHTTLRLRQRSRVVVIATGGQESVGGPADTRCEVRVDGEPAPVGANPGEETSDNTSGAATNGFA